MSRRGSALLWVLGVVALGAVRCGGATAGSSEQASGGADAGDGADGSSGSAGGNGGSFAGGSGGAFGFGGGAAMGGFGTGGIGTGGGDIPDECAATSFPYEPRPVAMHVMLDQSVIMTKLLPNSESLWQATTAGIEAFVNAPRAAGISFGIQYFGNPTDACNPAHYSTAEVAIGELPGVASAIVSSLANHSPQGSTPTVPALDGALQYVASWAEQNAFHRHVVVLLTAAYPSECQQSMPALSALASAALRAEHQVHTYVIGIGALVNYDVVAKEGGTGKAILLGDSSPNLEQEVTAALFDIAADRFGCVLQLPPPPRGQTIDPDKVNVQFKPESGAPRTLLRVSSEADCGAVSEGWYYDNPIAPAEIIICPDTCAGFQGGRLEIVFGCPTVTPP